MKPIVAVIDHGAGNLVSIGRGLERAGAMVRMVTTPTELVGVQSVVLPGVGATATVMHGLDQAGFREPLLTLEIPLFGICVGMQVLFDNSEEDGTTCLGLIPGVVRKLENAPRLPHIGWNDLRIHRQDPMFDGIPPGPVYFVHSYAPVARHPEHVVATTTHGSPLTAAVRRGLVSGTQFHPERSAETGLAILANVVNQAKVLAA